MSSNQPESCGSSSQNKRSGKRKQWSNEKMEQAIKAVDGGMSITMASSTFSVPRKTLDDRINPFRPYSLELCLTFRISFINHVISSKICKNHRKSYSTMSDIQHDKVWSPKN